MATYNYTKSPVAVGTLRDEILAETGITATLTNINYQSGTSSLDIFFATTLSAPEVTLLNAIVAAHGGVHPPTPAELPTANVPADYVIISDGSSGSMWVPRSVVVSGVNHSALADLDNDDHPQYSLADGSRPFTGTVSGVSPIDPDHLTTKFYVDDAIASISGVLDEHNELLSIQGGTANEYYHLTSSEHTNLTSAGGVSNASTEHIHDDRYFTESEITTISGDLVSQFPTQYTDELAQDAVGNIMVGTGTVTITYDDAGNTITVSGMEAGGIDHGDLAGLGDDDHTQYSLVDGTRAFTGTVSGVYPTDPDHLVTKEYVDGEDSHQSKYLSWSEFPTFNGTANLIGWNIKTDSNKVLNNTPKYPAEPAYSSHIVLDVLSATSFPLTVTVAVIDTSVVPVF